MTMTRINCDQNSSITSLPPEIITEIFRYLLDDPVTISNLATVNKIFFAIINAIFQPKISSMPTYSYAQFFYIARVKKLEQLIKELEENLEILRTNIWYESKESIYKRLEQLNKHIN